MATAPLRPPGSPSNPFSGTATNPNFGSLNNVAPSSHSTYHSLQAGLNRQFSQGFVLGTAYMMVAAEAPWGQAGSECAGTCSGSAIQVADAPGWAHGLAAAVSVSIIATIAVTLWTLGRELRAAPPITARALWWVGGLMVIWSAPMVVGLVPATAGRVLLDGREADLRDVVDGRAERVRLRDRLRARLELVRELAPRRVLVADGADHVPAEVERRHLVEQLGASPQAANARRPVKFVRRESVKVRADRGNIDG